MNTSKKESSTSLMPTLPSQRIVALDVLRGVAVLGILIMNIQSYSMIDAAYINPTAYGDLTGLNRWMWMLSHIFGDQKFMTIFSLLFGAGIVLMANRIEAKGLSPASIHYRRTFWLLIIGVIHAYLLWYGDILVIYALCALFVFLFRKMSPKKLLIIGLIFIGIPSVLYLMSGLSMPFWPPEAIESTLKGWQPAADIVQQYVRTYQAGWLDQMPSRVHSALNFHTFLFLFLFGWRAGGLMLIGMALYKWGVLTAERSNKFFHIIIAIGLLIGLPVVSYGVYRNFEANWSLEFSMFLGWQFNYWGSLFVSFAYLGTIILLCKSKPSMKMLSPFAAVGRMALSNYLLQTIICTTIFYGHGFGLFGRVERTGQVVIMLAIWIVQLIISPIWLRYFRYGPAEWLWRSLTHVMRLPMGA